LLAFSRKQAMDPKIVDLNQVITKVSAFLIRVIGEDIVLRFHHGMTSLPVNVDSAQIEQVLINLASNARDAMPKGGSLTIETGLHTTDAQVMPAEGFGNPGRYAVIEISDTGLGMDRETCSRVFDPFFTTKEVGKGTGLGLAIVYGIVEQHQGFIKVASEPGEGTTFRIYLPVVKSDPAAEAEQAGPEAPPRGSETILLAEDEDGVRNLASSILTKYGYRVIEAKDGQEAVEMFTAHRDSIGMVLMDIIMPKKNGTEAFAEIVQIQPGTRVLFFSGYTADFIKARGVAEEGINLIMKPVRPLELLHMVRKVLDSRPLGPLDGDAAA
jgi:CheY-like chemotaxis protein